MYTALLLLLLVAMSRTKANSRVLTPRQAPRQPRLACNPLAATPSRTLTQPPLSVGERTGYHIATSTDHLTISSANP